MTWRWSLNLEHGWNFPWEHGLGFKWSRVLICIPICIIVHQLSRCMVAKLMISVQAIWRVLICIPICIILHQLLGCMVAKLVISRQMVSELGSNLVLFISILRIFLSFFSNFLSFYLKKNYPTLFICSTILCYCTRDWVLIESILFLVI